MATSPRARAARAASSSRVGMSCSAATPPRCMRQPTSPETSSAAPASCTCADLVAAHGRGDVGELDRRTSRRSRSRSRHRPARRARRPAARRSARARRSCRAARGAGGRSSGTPPAGARPSWAPGSRAARAARRTRRRAPARAPTRGSPWNSSGQACSIVAAHEPESTTIGPSLAASASSVVAATRRASSGKPEFQAGWPQHVCPSGNVTR